MDIPAFFQSLADDFMAGRHQSFAEAVLHPLVIYSPDEIRIEKSPQQTLDVLSQRLASARMAGAVKAVSETRESGVVSKGRVPIDVIWRFMSRENVQTGVDEVRYFLRKDVDGQMRIELMEVISSTLTQGNPSSSSPASHAQLRH